MADKPSSHTQRRATLIHVNQANRNITLSLPKETLQQVKILAAKRDTSVSALLREKLEELLREESDYERAHREFIDLLDKGFDLGTGGDIKVSRDELHER